MEETRGEQAPLREWHLKAPLAPQDIGRLRAGDMVYLTGPIFTARDGVYRYMLKEGHEPPVDIRSITNVTIQSSPAGVEVSPGVYRVSSLQATAGFRYAQWMPALLERFGVKAVIGKAGMAEEVYKDLFRKHGAIYLSTVGYGLGAIYGRSLKGVRGVYWVRELGISEALWVLEVEELGPLLVEGDAQGNSFFAGVNREINRRLEGLYRGLREPILRRLGEERTPDREMF
jgi:L(+)-tartrate dehydratase beta subunit